MTKQADAYKSITTAYHLHSRYTQKINETIAILLGKTKYFIFCQKIAEIPKKRGVDYPVFNKEFFEHRDKKEYNPTDLQVSEAYSVENIIAILRAINRRKHLRKKKKKITKN